MSSPNPISYADSGVDIQAGDAFVEALAPLAKRTRRQGSMDQIGGFGGLFDLKALDMNDPVLVAGCDGIGSKIDIAMALSQYDTLGFDLVAMCVNDILCQNAEPLFFLDYLAVNKLDPAQNLELIKGISAACLEAGCQLIGGETAELPTLYSAGKFDLAGFAVGAVERDAVLPRSESMQAGDRLIGIASSGAHSNGYSLLQRVIKEAGLSHSDQLDGQDETIGSLMLAPTRIYVKPGLEAAHLVKGFAHITGGGLAGNVKRVLPKGLCAQIDVSNVEVPALFDWAVRAGWVTVEEAYRVWNMGVGLVAVVDADADIDAVIAPFAAAGFAAHEIGRLSSGDESAVIAHSFADMDKK